MTYTNRLYTNGTYQSPNWATLNVTNVINYIASYSTKFSMMQGQSYNTVSVMQDVETQAINAGWYAVVAI